MTKSDSPSGDKWKQEIMNEIHRRKSVNEYAETLIEEALNLAEEHFTKRLKMNAKAMMQLHNIYKKQKEKEISRLKKQRITPSYNKMLREQGAEIERTKFKKLVEDFRSSLRDTPLCDCAVWKENHPKSKKVGSDICSYCFLIDKHFKEVLK